MSVDNDMSTNDTIIGLSSGQVEIPIINDINSKNGIIIQDALLALTKV